MPATVHAPRTYTIPKPSGGLRLMSEPAPPDARRWQSLARDAAPAIERRLGPEVLANRWSPSTGRPRPLAPALGRARRAAARLASRSGAVLHVDVRAFYPSVDAGVLAGSVTSVGVDRGVAEASARMVESWAGHGVPGLPVGPPPSALFANAVLVPGDAALRARGIPFLRWVDDYAIGIDSVGPDAILEMLDQELDHLGLVRAAEKTRIEVGVVTWPARRSCATEAPTIRG